MDFFNREFTSNRYALYVIHTREGINMKKVLNPVFLIAIVLVMVGSMFSGTSNVFASEKSGQVSEVELKVMTYNLRYLNNNDPSPHTWAERVPAIKKLIRMERPDIIGTQEVLYEQLQDLNAVLPDYDWI